MIGRCVRVVLIVLAAGAAPAIAAPAPAPQVRTVQPRAASGSREVRVCHVRHVRRRDRDRHWHNGRIKLCHTERVR